MKCALRKADMCAIPTRDFAGLMALYESNYIRLRNLVPDLDVIPDTVISNASGALDLHLRILERCRFTTTLNLTYHFHDRDGMFPAPDMRVRLYHDARVGEVASAVDDVLAGNKRLVKGLGKKVFEIKPALPWDKGRAVGLLLDTLGMSGDDTVAVFIGDDITDEAAFRELRQPNVSIIVVDDDRATAADYALTDTEDVREFLNWLAQTAEGGA